MRLHSHALGRATNLLFGASGLAARYGADLPESLDGAPLLLPAQGLVREGLRRWFTERSLAMRVTGEFDDAGLLRTFGIRGHGLEGVIERYYAISCERRVRHEGVAAVIAHARPSSSPRGRERSLS